MSGAYITPESLLSALTSEWQGSRQVWEKLGEWAEVSVSLRLNQMTANGTIERQQQLIRANGQFRWVYRLKGEGYEA